MDWATDKPRELRLLHETRRLANIIIGKRRSLVEIDKRRQSIRSASSELKAIPSHDEVTFMSGPLLITLPQDRVKLLLEKDFAELSRETNTLKSTLKEDVNLLNELELKQPLKGFDLEALSRPEMAAVNQVLGFTSN